MNIDIEKLKGIEKKGDQIFFSKDGEKELVKVLEIEKQVENTKDTIKKKLEETALKLDPNFNSIQGDKVKIYYRTFGARYYIQPGFEERLPQELVKKQTKYSLDMPELLKYEKEKGGLPVGVRGSDREKQITFRFLEDKDE